MIGQLIKSCPKRSFTVLVMALFIFTTAYSFHYDAHSEADGLLLIDTCDRKPTTDERIEDLALSIFKIDRARLLINQYTCKSKQKCKPVDYAQTLKDLQSAVESLRMEKQDQVKSCMSMFGCSLDDCVEFSHETHSALHIVEDLTRTIIRKNKGLSNISSEENKVMRRYLGMLTVHLQRMKNVLKCLKNASVKDKSQCDSLRPPKYGS